MTTCGKLSGRVRSQGTGLSGRFVGFDRRFAGFVRCHYRVRSSAKRAICAVYAPLAMLMAHYTQQFLHIAQRLGFALHYTQQSLGFRCTIRDSFQAIMCLHMNFH